MIILIINGTDSFSPSLFILFIIYVLSYQKHEFYLFEFWREKKNQREKLYFMLASYFYVVVVNDDDYELKIIIMRFIFGKLFEIELKFLRKKKKDGICFVIFFCIK